MMMPTIHLNGTPWSRLYEELMNCSHALQDAALALMKTEPNGRDYYPQGPDAINAAIREHVDRMKRIDSVKNEIDAIRWNLIELQQRTVSP